MDTAISFCPQLSDHFASSREYPGVPGGLDLDVGLEGGQLFAQVGDVDPHHVDFRPAVKAPDLLQEPLAWR